MVGEKKAVLSGGFCMILAFSLLLLPLPWVIAAALAALFHESCHYLAIRICTKQDVPIHFFAFGARLPLPAMSRSRELICSLAGPLGGFLLLFLSQWLPRTAICGAFQSIYNLLPLYPMDGGRAIYCIASILLPPPRADRFCRITEKLCILGLILLTIYGVFWLHLGLMPLLILGILLLRIKFSKMPCKVAT